MSLPCRKTVVESIMLCYCIIVYDNNASDTNVMLNKV